MFRDHQITLPTAFVEKYGLPSSLVNIEHVKELFNFQEKAKLKLAPALTKDVIEPNHFQVTFITTYLNI